MSKYKRKIKVTLEFIGPDGLKGKRSLMDDFQTLRGRIFARIQEIASSSEPILMPGINSYNEANFEKALMSFRKTINEFPKLGEELAPHIIICERVLKISLNSDDNSYEKIATKWKDTLAAIRLFKSPPIFKIRCKYCGHYTQYIDPEYGLAYVNTNNCNICSRGYPVPDFAWDGIDGQAYIYYRNSVIEPEFYREFESRYDVSPNHTHFLKK